MAAVQDVNWERLDKQKFFIQGGALFSSLTAALFPLTVIKTRMMALDGAPTGLRGAVTTGRDILRADGPRGLYKGFGTVICGAIPARIVYLAALESGRTNISSLLHRFSDLPAPVVASTANFLAGGAASLTGQLVIVPIDVVSQRQMIMGAPTAASAATAAAASSNSSTRASSIAAAAAQPLKQSALQLAQRILREEGFRGFYRGFGASVATFVPSSSIWWASYGGWQSLLWSQLQPQGGGAASVGERSEGQMLGVQIVAGLLTGCTSAVLTTPLDVVKTRLQTREGPGGGQRATWRGTAVALLRSEGVGGFFRGVAPRMVSTSIWGTTMVTAYEFLKRMCVLPESEEPSRGAAIAAL